MGQRYAYVENESTQTNEKKAIVCSIVLKREHANFQLSNYLLLENNRPNTTTKL